MTLDNFMPYCWIGTDDRGICFAADTDRGWVHGKERDAVEIWREKDGTVVLKLNLIADSGRHLARQIELALQASPVKLMPKGWRGWVDVYDVKGTRNMLCQASSPTWGCYINGMARYPTFGDWSFVRKMVESARTGRADEDYLERWIARCLDARKNTPQLVPWLAAQKDDAAAEANLRAHAGVQATSIEGPFPMKDAAEKTRVTRTMLATLLPHEVQPTLSMTGDHQLVRRVLELRQQFGIGADDCAYTAYYDKANPVVQANPDVAISTYRRGDRLLLVIGSFAKTAVELPLRLHKGRIARAVDLETDKPLACDRGAASLRLKSHDFALVLVVCGTPTGSPLARR